MVLPELAPLWSPPASGVAAGTLAAHAVGASALQVAATAGHAGPVRFAALVASLPAAQIESLCARLRAPSDYRELALLAVRLGEHLHGGGGAPPPVLARDPDWVLELLESADAFRRPERFDAWLRVLGARAIAGGVPPATAEEFAATLGAAAERAAAVRLAPADLAGLHGAGDRRPAARAAARSPGAALGRSQQPPQVLQPETAHALVPVARQRHDLEGLAHLARQQQLPRLAADARARACIGAGGDVRLDAVAEQERRLRAVARDLEPASRPRPRPGA